MSASENNDQELVLLGGTGFVGSAVLRGAVSSERDGFRVRALVRGAPNRIKLPGVESISGDLASLPDDLFPRRPYVVLHFANKQIDSDNTGFHEVNVDGTKHLISALTPHCQGIIYGSSMSVYGQKAQFAVEEDAPTLPETPLARSRLCAEQHVLKTACQRGISAFVLRPRFIIGRGDQHTLPALHRLFRKGLRIGDGTQRFTIIDVDDYAAIILALARRIAERCEANDPLQTALNVGYVKSVSLNDIRSVINEFVQLKNRTWSIPAWLADVLRWIPIGRATSLSNKLELIGRHHVGDVKRLESEVGISIIGRDPREALTQAVKLLMRNPMG